MSATLTATRRVEACGYREKGERGTALSLGASVAAQEHTFYGRYSF